MSEEKENLTVSEIIIRAKREAMEDLIDLLERSLIESGEDFLDIRDLTNGKEHLMNQYTNEHIALINKVKN